MPKEHHASQQKTGLARVLLLIVLAIFGAGNYALWIFSRFRSNPFPAMPGLVVGCALVSFVLIIAICIRKPMARTALVVFIWIMTFVFSMPGLIMMSDRSTLEMAALKWLAVGIGTFVVGNVILIVAGPIHRLGARRGCGNR